MYAQNILSAAHIRVAHHHLAVETAGTHQSRVQNIRAVRCRNHDDTLVRAEAVHLNEQLVQRLLTFVVAAAETRAALAAHGIDFIDEDDARVVFLGFVEQVTHTRCTDADEHLHEVGTRNGEERHAGFACNGARQKRFTGARRANEQHALRNARTELVILIRTF